MSQSSDLFDLGRKDAASGKIRLTSEAQDWRYQAGHDYQNNGWSWGSSATTKGDGPDLGWSSGEYSGGYSEADGSAVQGGLIVAVPFVALVIAGVVWDIAIFWMIGLWFLGMVAWGILKALSDG